MVHLFEDVLCSGDEDGHVAWHASSGIVLETFELPKCSQWSLVKLNNTEVAFLCGVKKINILKHAQGRDIEQVRETEVSNIKEISGMDGYGKTVTAIGVNGRAEIYDCVAGTRNASFNIGAMMDFVKNK